jgi:hypothetical protein
MRRLTAGCFILVCALGLGCDEAARAPFDSESSEPPPTLPPAANAVRGRALFGAECASCHASGDGLDLAFFAFTDTTILRRAVAHVDTVDALDIVAHIRTVGSAPTDRRLRLFQPGGQVVGSDTEFAARLFGADTWPLHITTADLLAIDPLGVRVAVALPLWSAERDNTDWMPEVPLPDAILDDQGGYVRGQLAGYRAAPSLENLGRAVLALRTADRRAAAGAPCLLDDPELARWLECFEVRRWTSSLVAQHMIRYGLAESIHPVLHATWWDVGNVVRRAMTVGGVNFPNGNQNWASWMYLGWMFDPAGHASVYTGNGLNRIGLPRHSTFVALRSQVARPRGSSAAYADANNAATFAPVPWAYGATRFALNHLLERQQIGDLPLAAARADAIMQVERAYARAAPKVTPAQRLELEALARQVIDGLTSGS